MDVVVVGMDMDADDEKDGADVVDVILGVIE